MVGSPSCIQLVQEKLVLCVGREAGPLQVLGAFTEIYQVIESYISINTASSPLFYPTLNQNALYSD